MRDRRSIRRPEAVMTETGNERKAQELYKDLLAYLRRVKKKVASGTYFDLKTPTRILTIILADPELRREMSSLSVKAVQEIDSTIPHQVNSMIYALLIGSGLKRDESTLVELGLASLLHDVGLYVIPQEILRGSDRLTAADAEVMRAHPEFGRDLLSRFKRQHPLLPEVVYQHHERMDGTGYPRGLKGDEIHDLARIIGLADAFEAMTHDRPHRKRLKQSFTVKEIAKSGHLLFSPEVFKAFLQEITPYPVGCLVMLNNKMLCEVVATDRRNPLRPSVRVLYDREGNKVAEGKTIHLTESKDHHIVDCVSPETLLNRR